MEVIEYLGKYNLENTEHFPYNNFVDDLKKDFDDLVREFDAMQDMSTYRFCINSLRAKSPRTLSGHYQSACGSHCTKLI